MFVIGVATCLPGLGGSAVGWCVCDLVVVCVLCLDKQYPDCWCVNVLL